MEIYKMSVYSGGFLLLFAIIELLYYKFNLDSEITRKIVHFATGIIALSFPLVFDKGISIILLCAIFFGVLLLSKKLKLLPSINNIKRVSNGSTLFPITVITCFYAFKHEGLYVFYYLPLLILAICDPVAALAGKKFKYGKYKIFGNTKTLSGNLGFFISCFILCMLIGALYHSYVPYLVLLSLGVSLLCTFAEGVSVNGYDNITIPSTAIVSLLFIKQFLL